MISRVPVWSLALAVIAIVVHTNVAATTRNTDSTTIQSPQIEALEARIKRLEDRLDKPLSVKAPFLVTDDAGRSVFRVTSNGGAELALGGDTSPLLQVSDKSGEALLQLQKGEFRSAMRITSQGAVVAAAGPPGSSFSNLTVTRNTAGMSAASDQSRSVGLGAWAEGPRLRLVDGGKQIIRAGGGSIPEFVLGEDSAPAMKATGTADAAQLSLTNGNATLAMRVTANGDSRTSLLSGSGNRVTLQADNSGLSGLQADSGGGDNASNWSQIVVDKEGPRLKIGHNGIAAAELGAPAGKRTGLRVYDDKGGLALSAGLGTIGKVGISLWQNDTEPVAAIVSNDQNEGVFEVYRPGNKIAAQLGRMQEGQATALRIYDNEGAVALGAGLDANGQAAVRIANAGKPVASITAFKDGLGSVDVVANGKAVASLNNLDNAGDGGVYLHNKSGGTIATLTNNNGEGALELLRSGDKLAVQIGAPSGKGTALRIFDSSGAVAMGAGIDTEGQSAVRVAAKGAYIAGITATPDGFGSIDVLSKGKSVASMNNADKPGQALIAVRNEAGSTVAALQLGSNRTGGNVTLYDAAGQGVFSAGNATDGWGEACVTRQNGKTHCLGIGLPGMLIGDGSFGPAPLWHPAFLATAATTLGGGQ